MSDERTSIGRTSGSGSARYAVGLDFGTESVRAVVVDICDGRVAGQANVDYPHGVIDRELHGGGGALPADFALQHPGDWIESAGKACRAAIAEAGDGAADRAIGIGVDFTSCTMLPTKRDGTPLCLMEAFAKVPLAWPKLWKHHGAKEEADRINQIALANATGHDAWINVPFLANDDYVRHMADLFRDNMNPNAHIQVELSNEVWNSTFSQFFQARDAANNNPELASIPDDFTKAAKAYALRAKQVSDIFHQEFGAQSNRVQMIFGGQGTNTYWAQQGLDYVNQKFGNPNKTAAQNVSQWFNSLTIAPYFGDNSSEVQANSQNLDTLFSYLMGQVSSGGYLDLAIKDAKTQANSYGLGLVAYEGGDSLPKASNNLSDSFLRAAQADPRMYQVLSQLYNTWNADGGGLFMAFSHIGGDKGGGLWGLLNSDALSGSQKWDATISRLVPAGDLNLDGVVDYKDLLVLAKNFGMKNAFWQDGDFNHDGVVDAQDLSILAADYGQGTPFAGYTPQLGSSFAADWAAAQAAAVPEPASSTLAALAFSACLLRRRRR